MKDEENKFISDKIDRLGLWMKKSLDFELDPKTLENLKRVAGKSTEGLERLMATVLTNLDHRQPVEKGIGIRDLFLRLRKILPQLTEEDARKIFNLLRQLVERKINRK